MLTMNNKKEIVVLGLLFVILISMSFISAAYTYGGSWGGGFGMDIRSGSEQLINFVVGWAEPFLQVTLGGYDYSGYLLFEKFLLFLLLMSIVYVSLKNISVFSENKGVLLTVAIIVPLLAVRFLDFAWLNTILIQYQVLGVALLGLLPFIIYLFFLHNVSDDATIRKIGWIFFIVIYFGLWSTTQTDNYAEVYFWTMIIAFLFLLFDGTIHRALSKQKWKEADRSGVMHALNHVNAMIRQYQNPIAGVPENMRQKELRRLNKRKVELQKELT